MFPDVREALTPPSGQRLCCGEGREGRHRRAGACPARTDLLSALIQSQKKDSLCLLISSPSWPANGDDDRIIMGKPASHWKKILRPCLLQFAWKKSAWSPPSFNAHGAVATSTIRRPDLVLTSPPRWQVGDRYRDSFPAPSDRAQRPVLSRSPRSRHETDQSRSP